jgi:hypothetical protein
MGTGTLTNAIALYRSRALADSVQVRDLHQTRPWALKFSVAVRLAALNFRLL